MSTENSYKLHLIHTENTFKLYIEYTIDSLQNTLAFYSQFTFKIT